jgi:curved DNA-binding protein CbpA
MGTLYELLAIPRDASDSQIRKAYHRAALKYHPDKQRGPPSPESSALFIQIVEAFTVLSNESLRASYDRELELRDAANRIDRERQAMIDDLAAREARSDAADPLDIYRADVKDALRNLRPKSDSFSFDDYRRIILSSLRKGG